MLGRRYRLPMAVELGQGSRCGAPRWSVPLPSPAFRLAPVRM